MKKWLILLGIAAGSTVWGQNVELRLRQAQDLARRAPAVPVAQAQAMLEGIAADCDNSHDASCPEAYAWLGASIERENADNLDVLREKVAPLYAKAVERSGGSPAPLTLELQGRLLQKIGPSGEAQTLLTRAASMRKSIIAEMTSPALAGDPPAMRSGGGIERPQLLQRQEPEYTDLARFAKQQGTVLLQVTVGTDGAAHDIRLVRSLGFGLDEQAVYAVEHWKFQPGTREGKPVAVLAQIEVNFRLL